MMPIAIVLIFGVMIAIVLIGFIWSFLLLVPFYAFIGVAGLLVRRSRLREAEIAASVKREAERQRLFNEQEMQAWQAALQNERRVAATQEKMLCRFDNPRDPPNK